MKVQKELWKKVQFGRVVDHVERTDTNPEVRASSRFVSVEHLITGKLKIESWFNEEMPTFFRSFEPGQVLFGKRRAYQRKVAIADFHGICSPHIWALNSKNGLLQELLPFVMLTDKFYEYVNANSAGTMSVYLKWPQLSKYPFLLPPVDEQKRIISLFLEIESTIDMVEKQEKNFKSLELEIIKNLTSVKPQMGNFLKIENLQKTSLGQLAFEYAKREDNPRLSKYERYIGSDSIGRFDFKVQKWQSNMDVISSMKIFEPKDYLLVRRSLYASDFRERAPRADFCGLCSGDILTIKENHQMIYDGYLLIILNSPRLWDYIVANASGSITRRIKWKDLSKFEIIIPDKDTQRIIVEIFDQIQNLTQQLQQQISDLKALRQKLLNEILG